MMTGQPDSITPGEPARLTRRVRRLTAPNPGFMTGPGTNTYLVGTEAIAIIDPGPADSGHLDAIIRCAGGDIRWILVTHTHKDHSPGAAVLAKRTGAPLLGMRAPGGDNQDRTFTPHVELTHNQPIKIGEYTLLTVHTPGHASNHVCYLLEEERLLFTGDHIMQGSTVVISPPDGDMRVYLESLRSLTKYDLATLAPGHGTLLQDPAAVIAHIVQHRLDREAKIVAVLRDNPPLGLDALVRLVYDDVPAAVHVIASHSLLAHLIKLQRDGRAEVHNDTWQIKR